MLRNAMLVALIAALALAGCASDYQNFCRPASGTSPEGIAATRVAPPPKMPIVEHSQPLDPQLVIDAYGKRGYGVIGASMFNSSKSQSENGAIKQAKSVGADLVLILNSKYTGSVTSSVPITTPNTTTVNSSGRATAYGPGGSVTAYGNGTTTVNSSTTNYVPMTANFADYGAVYFVKQKMTVGLSVRDLNDSERQELQTNKGVVIRWVGDSSPAFDADLLVGDIITTVDDVPVSNFHAFFERLNTLRGKAVVFGVRRQKVHIDKTIQLRGT